MDSKEELRQRISARREKSVTNDDAELRNETQDSNGKTVCQVDGYGNPTSVQEICRPIMRPEMVWIAYVFSWVGIISAALGCDRKHKYVKHHLNNALVANIVTTVCSILMLICKALATYITLTSFSWYSSSTPAGAIVCSILGVIFGLGMLYGFIMLIIGWISALRGRTNNLPLVSKIKLFK